MVLMRLGVTVNNRKLRGNCLLFVEYYVLDHVGKVRHDLDLATRPMMRLCVPRAQCPYGVTCVADDRYADVSAHYAALCRRVIPEYRVVGDVVDYEWRATRDCVYAERVGERVVRWSPMSFEREAIPTLICSTSVIMFSAAFGIPTASMVNSTI